MKRFFPAVLLTSLVAGTLDISAAYIRNNIRTNGFAANIFNYIAGAALGLQKSMTGGSGAMFTGMFFHYFIAFVFTLLFFLIYRPLKLNTFNKYITGVVYGLLVWLIMTFIVIPLSLLPSAPFSLVRSMISAWIVMGTFGLPVSLGADYHFRKVKADDRRL